MGVTAQMRTKPFSLVSTCKETDSLLPRDRISHHGQFNPAMTCVDMCALIALHDIAHEALPQRK